MSQPSLSPRGAVVLGLLVAALGVAVVLVGAHADDASIHAPRWVVALAGLTFVLAGAAVILGQGLVGARPGGDLPSGTPVAVRVIQLGLGLAIVAAMTAISGWIAFGPGQRRFGGTLVVPFVAWPVASSEAVGRTVFGVGTVLVGLMFVAIAVTGVRRIARHAAADRAKAAAAARHGMSTTMRDEPRG